MAVLGMEVLFLSLVLLLSGLQGLCVTAVTEYHVKPTSPAGYNCERTGSCLSLSEYFTNISLYLESNTTFYLLPGTHILSISGPVVMSNVSNLSLIGMASGPSTPTPLVTIECAEGGIGFVFLDVQNLSIVGVEIIGCGTQVPTDMLSVEGWLQPFNDPLLPVQTRSALLVKNVHSLLLDRVHVRESYGYGFLGINVYGNITVSDCKFLYNYWREMDYDHDLQQRTHGGPGGNMNIIFTGCEMSNCNIVNVSIIISSSEFAHGVCDYHYVTVGCLPGFGVYTEMSHLEDYIPMHIHTELQDNTFYNNNGINGGNVVLSITEINVTFSATNCSFDNGRSETDGGGLNFMLHQPKLLLFRPYYPQMIVVLLNHCNFTNNHAGGSGGGLHINAFIDSDIFCITSTNFSTNDASYGGALYIGHGFSVGTIEGCMVWNNTALTEGAGLFVEVYPSFSLTVLNTLFLKNTAHKGSGGCIHMLLINSWNDNDANVVLQNCTFAFSAAPNGSGVASDQYVYSPIVKARDVKNITLSAVNFHHNSYVATPSNTNTDPLRLSDCTVVYLEGVGVTLRNSVFAGNNCTAIYTTHSVTNYQGKVIFVNNVAGGIRAHGFNNLNFQGHISFINNSAKIGGAMKFTNNQLGSSLLFLMANTTVHMSGNRAQAYGGAIAIDNCYRHDDCFFQIEHLDLNTTLTLLNITDLNISVIMDNNTAGIAGDSIYGGCLKYCYIMSGLQRVPLERTIFDSIFIVLGIPSQSEIAAKASEVCFCTNETVGKSCPNTTNRHVFRGQLIQVGVMGVGVNQYSYASPAYIRAVLEPAHSGNLGERQQIQEVGNTCEKLIYSVMSHEDEVQVILNVDGFESNFTVLTVSFLPCPLGFEMVGDPPSGCVCIEFLRKQAGVHCNSDKWTIICQAGIWVGNVSDVLAVHSHCPFDYCIPGDTELDLTKQDEQCAFNRSGVLCGECQPGLSLVLGSSKCLHCSHVYLLLLLPFTLAGIVLILFLMICNLTVSTGTINELIFYANIVQVNSAVLFPSGESNIDALKILIAWINLDLGLEICFAEALNAYIKTWFQYLFPFYIWSLVGTIIYTSRRSTIVSRLMGSNTVPVLATLFLLSYAKLLRTIIASVSFTTVTDKNGDTTAVWLLDGNVPYCRGPHIALFLFAVMVTLGFVAPYTVLVLLSPWLQAKSNHWLLRWVHRFKPLIDAYQGPYKDNARYWTGLMLASRVVLFAAFAGNALGDPRINLLAVDIGVAFLLVLHLHIGYVYKSRLMNVLESFFLLNLGVFAGTALYLRTAEVYSHRKLEVLSSCMVGSVLLVFFGIVAYHCYVLLKKQLQRRRPPTPQTPPQQDGDREDLGDGSAAFEAHQPTVSVIELSQLREPLLTDN